MSAIHFDAKLSKIGDLTIVRLPKDASTQLPSRGLVMVEGTIDGSHFLSALEPDGKGSHWFRADKATSKKTGDTVTLAIEPVKEWPEPDVPEDLQKALNANPEAYAVWMDITPMARWDWIRWIRATHNPETRQRRIEVTFSKFESKKRRPCCFNRTECTDPEVSKGGILLDSV